MTILITVSGYASGSFAPEQALVAISVSAQDADREVAAAKVASTHTRLSTELKDLEQAGAVARWSSSSVSTYSYRPHDREGKEQAPVQVASVSVSATFTDFVALSPAVDGWLRDPLISLGHIAWRLTKEHRQERLAEVRRDAVHNAVAKAQAYADALGAGPVEAVEIADAGMLPAGTPARGSATYGAPMAPGGLPASAMAAPDAVELRPADIDLSVSVDARFTAPR